MIIGFTGTQNGMTIQQLNTVSGLHEVLNAEEIHHGDCTGSDFQFHDIIRIWFLSSECVIVVHPPENPSKRAFCDGDLELPPKSYLERSHDIVRACDVLIATPKTTVDELRSGTWATVRYARKIGKPIIIVLPNGTTKKENFPK